MILKPDTRLKIRKFFNKYGKIIFIVLAIWLFIVTADKLMKLNKNYDIPNTTYEPHSAIINNSEKTPKKVQKSMEDFVNEYVEHCNKKEYQEAYDMISEDCKEYIFGNLDSFKSYVDNKFMNNQIYSIQDYSNYNDKYIYNVKLCDDVLATGLTGATYMYQQEKITASYDEDGKIVFGVGNFIEKDEIESVQENDYLKVSIDSKIVCYSTETYQVTFTNRSDKTIVVSNGYVEKEMLINLDGQYRVSEAKDIILSPEEKKTVNITFQKFYDTGRDASSILFDSIRVVDEYIEENPNEDNALYKFSMELGF